MDISPAHSDGMTASMDESMSPCDSLRSPEVEYIDNNETSGVHSIEKKASSALYISEHQEATGNICKREIIVDIESRDGSIRNIDDNLEDPQFCATMACDIYKHLRASKAPRQSDVVQCGFYVMAYMKHIIEDAFGDPGSIQSIFAKAIYSREDIDQVRTEWADSVSDLMEG